MGKGHAQRRRAKNVLQALRVSSTPRLRFGFQRCLIDLPEWQDVYMTSPWRGLSLILTHQDLKRNFESHMYYLDASTSPSRQTDGGAAIKNLFILLFPFFLFFFWLFAVSTQHGSTWGWGSSISKSCSCLRPSEARGSACAFPLTLGLLAGVPLRWNWNLDTNFKSLHSLGGAS